MKLGILGQKYVKVWYKYEYECGASIPPKLEVLLVLKQNSKL